MPPSPIPIEASLSQFRTLAAQPYPQEIKPKREKLTRSRDGCLTCRIRRKKCSGMPDTGGACEACQRLAIECLGYSAKRPVWMQNAEALNDCRREIRLWLAERGKGPRAIELLSLAKYYGDEAPAPNPPKIPKSNASNERRTRRMANAMSWVEEEDELEEEGDGEDGDGECEQDMDDMPLETISQDVLPQPVIMPAVAAGGPSGSKQADFKPRGRYTDLSQSYTWNFLDDEDGIDEVQAAAANGKIRRDAFNDAPVASLVSMWKKSVLSFQHRFANPKYFQELCKVMLIDPDAQAVTRNLAAIHGFNRNFGAIDQPEVKTARVELNKVQTAVKAKLLEDSRSQSPTVGSALAAMFGLSYVLFTGGTGDWSSYLEVASNWLDREMYTIIQAGAKYAYASAFLAELTVWMDIIGSVSLQRAPNLHQHYIKLLCSRDNTSNPHGLFLSRVLGCDRMVMLGIAATSALAGWKLQQATLGSLDTHELTDKGREIEEAYLSPPQPHNSIHPSELTHLPLSKDEIEAEPVALMYERPVDRPNVTLALHAAAKVYLATVVSGSLPHSENVIHAVDNSIEVLRGIDEAEADRAIVFALTITACLARDQSQKAFFLEKFSELKSISRGGNSLRAMRLVQEVWRRRETAGPMAAVDWWQVSDEIGGPLLLA